MAMKDYVPVMQRWAKMRADNDGKTVRPVFKVDLNAEKECALIRCEIYVDDKLVSEAHALAPALGEDKEFEKAETAALGRALAFLGYESTDVEESEEPKEKSKKSSGLGLGSSKKPAPKKAKEEVEEEEEDEEDDSDDDDNDSDDDGESDTSDSDDDSEEDGDESDDDSDDEDEEEKKGSKKISPESKSKMNDILAKHGLNKKK